MHVDGHDAAIDKTEGNGSLVDIGQQNILVTNIARQQRGKLNTIVGAPGFITKQQNRAGKFPFQ